MIGDLHDAAGRPAEAFAAYQASNAALKALNAARFEAPGTETALEQVRRLTAWFESADPEPWREAPQPRPRAADPAAHIFLVGFPRSGTTLLENVLAAHPQVVSLEEKNCLERVSAGYLASGQGLERLARISPGEAARQRDAYWSMVRGFGVEPRGRVFIDKFPLSSVQLPVVAKLFPNARVLFARRDPRDVVLSCFRRRFGMNPSMYQLLTLDGAAAYYDAVMRLSELYRESIAPAAAPGPLRKPSRGFRGDRPRRLRLSRAGMGSGHVRFRRQGANTRNNDFQRRPGRPRPQPRGPGRLAPLPGADGAGAAAARAVGSKVRLRAGLVSCAKGSPQRLREPAP